MRKTRLLRSVEDEQTRKTGQSLSYRGLPSFVVHLREDKRQALGGGGIRSAQNMRMPRV